MSDFIRPASSKPRYEESAPIGKTLWVIGSLATAVFLFFAIIVLTTA
jgi:hypothetical protein